MMVTVEDCYFVWMMMEWLEYVTANWFGKACTVVAFAQNNGKLGLGVGIAFDRGSRDKHG